MIYIPFLIYCIILFNIVYISLYINIRCKFSERIDTMKVATTMPRYDKFQRLLINDQEITLIDHLKQLREANKITKKKISNLIKNNDSWYSQVERNGKNGDDHRQRTIYRNDLIDIISIVKYDAQSTADLHTFLSKSEAYLDKIIKAIPITGSEKKLELYQLYPLRTDEEQQRFFASLLSSINKQIKIAFNSGTRRDRDTLLDCLKNMNASLKIDPIFLIMLCGQPFANFLYESTQKEIQDLLSSISKKIEEIDIRNENECSITKEQLFDELCARIKEALPIERNKEHISILPPDQVEF